MKLFSINLLPNSNPVIILLIALATLFPPLVLVSNRQYLLSLGSLVLITVSLFIAGYYVSMKNWPFPIWTFPLQLIIQLWLAVLIRNHLSLNSVLEQKLVLQKSLAGLVLIGITCGLLSQYGYTRYVISSVSMYPTLTHGDFVLLSAAKQSSFERGDLVVFKHPQENETYVKRIIAIGGDTLEIKDATIKLNGEILQTSRSAYEAEKPTFRWQKSEFYIESNGQNNYKISLSGEAPTIKMEITIPNGFYFVMGDNRNQSIDSRFWGLLPENNVIGQPMFTWWSINPGPYPQIRWQRIGTWLD